MKKRDYQRIKELFQSTVELAPTDRDDFLDKECGGDDSLRQEVERLLAAENSEFMEKPVIAEVAKAIGESENEPSKINSDTKTNKRFGNYKIISKISTGGMGEVFLAEDTSLDRQVAVKFLSHEFSHDTDKLNRFVQEAKAASALNHPNILTIHEIGQTDGTKYIASEFIEGKTLRNLLDQTELIPLDTVLNIAVQIAEALSAAHDAGIVHRDIKPENIMIRQDGYVKVLDFGLAKLIGRRTEEVESEGTTKILVKTDSGMVMGTASYISPEQARGKEVDARSDIFSFGVVLYELISGKVPFQGETLSDVLVSILEKEPIPIARYAPDTPADLQHTISKTIRKDKADRYQTMKSILADLKTLKEELEFEEKLERTESPESTENITDEPMKIVQTEAREVGAADTQPDQKTKSATSGFGYIVNQVRNHKVGAALTLGVLLISIVGLGYYLYPNTGNAAPLTDKDVILLIDFDNKTGEEIFDGTLKQGLVLQLRQSPFLSMIPDQQVRNTLKLMKRSPDKRVTREVGREICQRQGLKAYIAGTISKLGTVYVLGLEAVNSQTGETIAITQVEAKGKDQILKSLSEAATQIREKLGESLTLIEKYDKPLEEVTTKSLEALKAYTMGHQQLRNGKLLEAIPLLEKAVEIDPDFAMAYISLSGPYFGTSQFELGKEAIIKAHQLREKVSKRERILIDDYYNGDLLGDVHKSIEVLKSGITMYPRDAGLRNSLGFSYNNIGQHEKAIEEFREVFRQNPMLGSHGALARAYLRLNRIEAAQKTLEDSRKRSNDWQFGELYNIALIKNDTEEMQKQIDRSKGKPLEFWMLNKQADTAAYRGQWKKSRQLFRRAVNLAGQNNNKEAQSLLFGFQAIRAAILGQCSQVRSLSNDSPELVPHYFRITFKPLALVRCGENSRAKSLINEIKEKYPRGTHVQKLWLPTIEAITELKKGNPEEAVKLLEPAERYERVSRYWVQTVRAEAYLEMNKNEKAKAEFQKILDNRGLKPEYPLYSLAQLGKARATKDKREYEKFFEMWKDADENMPALIKAKKEYEELK